MSILPEPQAQCLWDACREERGPASFLLGHTGAGPQWLDPQPGDQPARPSARWGAPTAGKRGETPTGDTAGKQKNVPEAPKAVVERKLRLSSSHDRDRNGFRGGGWRGQILSVESFWGSKSKHLEKSEKEQEQREDWTLCPCEHGSDPGKVLLFPSWNFWITVGLSRGCCIPGVLNFGITAPMMHVVPFPPRISVSPPCLVVSKM